MDGCGVVGFRWGGGMLRTMPKLSAGVINIEMNMGLEGASGHACSPSACTRVDHASISAPTHICGGGHHGGIDESAQRAGRRLGEQRQRQLGGEGRREGHRGAAQVGHKVCSQQDGHVAAGGVGQGYDSRACATGEAGIGLAVLHYFRYMLDSRHFHERPRRWWAEHSRGAAGRRPACRRCHPGLEGA